jgi:hypothetical protein
MGHQLLRRDLQPTRRCVTFRFRHQPGKQEHDRWQAIPGFRWSSGQVEFCFRSCYGEVERFGHSRQRTGKFCGLHWVLACWYGGEDDSLCADRGPLVQ